MKYTDLMAHLGFGAPERKPLTDKKPVLNLTKASQVDKPVKPGVPIEEVKNRIDTDIEKARALGLSEEQVSRMFAFDQYETFFEAPAPEKKVNTSIIKKKTTHGRKARTV